MAGVTRRVYGFGDVEKRIVIPTSASNKAGNDIANEESGVPVSRSHVASRNAAGKKPMS